MLFRVRHRAPSPRTAGGLARSDFVREIRSRETDREQQYECREYSDDYPDALCATGGVLMFHGWPTCERLAEFSMVKIF